MTKIKHFDPNLNEWVIDGASNASNLELTNPGYLDENGKSVSVDNGFTKIDNRISKLEQNVAWIYLNGAKGGGGSGTGGGGAADYYIDLSYQPTTIYTTTGNVTLDIIINSGGLSKNFKVNVTGDDNIKYIQDKSQRSMTRFQLDITGIKENTVLEISAYDNNGIMTTPAYINVVVGALYLNMAGNPSKTIMIGGINPASITFSITNKTGSNAKFLLYESLSNDPYNSLETPVLELTIRLTEQNLTYSLRELCTNLSENGVLVPGKTFRFKAIAVQETLGLITPYKTHNVTVVNSDTLLIVTEGISMIAENATEFVLGGFVLFNYFFSYNLSNYTDFAYIYNVYKIEGNSETLIDSGRKDSGIFPNTTYSFGYNTANLQETKEGEYYKIVLVGYPSSDPNMSDANSVYTHTMYFKLAQADTGIILARNYNRQLLAYFGAFHFPSDPTGDWLYQMPDEDNYYAYEGSFKQTFKDGVLLKTYKVDGKSSGFLTDSNSVRCLSLPNGSYATIPAFKLLLREGILGENSTALDETMFISGFCISTTFFAEDSVDNSETILSLGNYENDDLRSGFEITLNKARVKIAGTVESTVPLPKGKLLTVDLNVTPIETTGTDGKRVTLYYFTIYLNGVMSGCSRVTKDLIDWVFGKELFLGCRNDLTHHSICKIYDFKIYTAPQSDVTIVQNHISAKELANLKNGIVDESLHLDLINSNFFLGKAENELNLEGPCLLWDYVNESYYKGNSLYNTLYNYLKEGSLNYPIVFVQEITDKSDAESLFEIAYKAVWPEGNSEILNTKYPVNITIATSKGDCIITKPDSVSDINLGPSVAIQGTSSLTYNSKNLEIYAGTTDGITPKLINVTDEWLPENEFTLKADVVDSGHVNNVAIGKIINETNILTKTPPMIDESLWTANGVNKERALEIRSKIKHTSDGFPCLLFVKFASGNVEFLGIYNFNLGRYAYYNLGLKILLDYEKPDNVQEGAPYTVENYRELTDGYSGGTYSLEINKHNDKPEEAFQQADENTVRYMSDCRYTSTNENNAYKAVTDNLYYLLALMGDKIPKKRKTGIGALDGYVEIPGETWGGDSAYYTYSMCKNYLSTENAMSYYIIAMIFGLIDSMCKNLTLRSWGGLKWWTCFYDMDTALKLDNSGGLDIAYWAHFHRFFNVTLGGLTTATEATDSNSYYQTTGIERWATNSFENGFELYFASTWSRLWEVLELLPIKDYNGRDENLGATYWKLRTGILRNPKEFIEKYYISYVNQCGSILYNYDYNIKYISISKKYVNGLLVDDTEQNQTSFLHGTRVDAVADWFEKRIYFLDSVYSALKPSSTDNPVITSIESPLNSAWVANKAGGKSEEDNTTATAVVKLASKSKIKYAYQVGSNTTIYSWLDETPKELSVMIPLGEKVVTILGNKYITSFDNFKKYNWTKLFTIEFPELVEIDLSELTLREPLFSLWAGSANTLDNLGLKNVKRINLSNLKITTDTSSLTLDVSNCLKLEELNLSGSSYTNFILPSTGSLKILDLSGTGLLKLGDIDANSPFENLPSLEVLNLSGCDKLHTIYINNCESLKTVVIPANVKRVWVVNCPSFLSVECTYSGSSNNISLLVEVHMENCNGLKTVNLQGQNNPDLHVSLLGCNNLENVNISNSSLISENIIFPAKGFKTLRSLNLSRTSMSYLQYGNSPAETFLDLKDFENLSLLLLQECSNISKVVCANNINNPIELVNGSFENCRELKDLYGNFIITGERVFSGCNSLKLNLDPTLDFVEGDNVTNISFGDINSGNHIFLNCSSLTINDFRYLMERLPESLTSLEGMFLGCISISGNIHRGLLNKCRNITSLKDAFADTQLNGALYSRRLDYSEEDESTWGFFDFVRNLTTLENAFSNTLLDYIDEYVFEPILESLTNIDYCFSNCRNLTTVDNTNEIIPNPKPLQTKTFFTQLKNLSNNLGWPINVFSGCHNVNMEITEDENGNTYLFHTTKNTKLPIVLTDTLYAGVNLIGYIGKNTFGGITLLIGDYYIPVFSSIQAPFTRCVGNLLKIKLSEVGNDLFQNQPLLGQIIRIFTGVICDKGYDVIPSGIFKNCTNLLNIQGLFSGMEITNNGNEYIFPSEGLFDDCTSLANISSLFSGQRNLKIKLVGEGFKNCHLTDVSQAFSSSGLFGVIPYKLWYMERNGLMLKTIKNMLGVFSNCVCIGYTSDREINTSIVTNIDDQGNYHYLDWSYGVPVEGKEGTRMYYTMELPSDNDLWQMDGRAWSKPENIDDATWENWYNLYFVYDEKQAKALEAKKTQVITYVENGYQNYIIPCDYFRYCSTDCSLSGSLSGINRRAPILINDESTGTVKIDDEQLSTEIYGLVGRIPCKIFEPLTENINITGVFSNVNVCAYVNYYLESKGTEMFLERGIKFPMDLFVNNLQLQSVSNMFSGMNFEVGVDINPDLFSNNKILQNVSGLFSKCYFDTRDFIDDNTSVSSGKNNQIPCEDLFKNNEIITDISNLFACGSQLYNLIQGPLLMESSLFKDLYLMRSISQAFANCYSMSGSVPEFLKQTHQFLSSVSGYLENCNRDAITNWTNIEWLVPESWIN